MPTFLTAFLGGGVFNPILVGVISAAGATIGELTGYLAGVGGKAIVEDRALYERFCGWMERYGLFALFALAAIPNPSSTWLGSSPACRISRLQRTWL